MIVEIHRIRTACECSGCGRKSKFVPGADHVAAVKAAKKAGWTVRLEMTRGRRHRRGFAERYYCKRCQKKVAAPPKNRSKPCSA